MTEEERVYEISITEESIKKECRAMRKIYKLKMPIEDMEDHLKQFYIEMYGKVKLSSGSIGKYRRGWLAKCDMDWKVRQVSSD